MHTTEYYSVIRKIEIMPFAGTVEHHTEWNKSSLKSQILHVFTHMKNLFIIIMGLEYRRDMVGVGAQHEVEGK
jgi:hypothetical protein